MSFVIIFVMVVLIIFSLKAKDYKESEYRTETNNKFLTVITDKGKYGEYLSARVLEQLPGYHRILVNLYLPTKKGTMSETDVLFLHETGIYVLESKNYSGWILGREDDKKWCQTFNNGVKEYFYNPIKQNQTHLKVIQQHLPHLPQEWFESIIVFSERCTLKKIEVYSSMVHVVKRNRLKLLMQEQISKYPKRLSKTDIDNLYNKLKEFTNVSEHVKQEHIVRITQKVK